MVAWRLSSIAQFVKIRAENPWVPLLVLAWCAFRYFRIVDLYAVNVFVGDQWLYHQPTLFNRASWWAIFRWETNPWREGLGGVLAALIEPIFRWNTRTECFIAAGIVVAACCLALWLKVRLFGPLTVWGSVIPLFVLVPTGHQTIVGVTHFSHGPLPFLLLILIAITWTTPNGKLRYLPIAVLTALSISTGFGLIAGIAVPALLLLELLKSARKEHPWRIAGLGLIAAAWLLFFADYSTANTGCPPEPFGFHPHNPAYYLLFVVFMFANAMGVPANHFLLRGMLLGFILVISIVWIEWKLVARHVVQPVPILLIGFSLAFAAATALGRMCVGMGAAFGSRYVIYLVPAFLGAYFSLLSEPDRSRKRWLIGLVAVALFASGYIHPTYREEMSTLSKHRSRWKACYLSTHDLEQCNQATHATPLTFPDTIQPQLYFLEQHHLNLFADES